MNETIEQVRAERDQLRAENDRLKTELCREQEKLKIEHENVVRANLEYLISKTNRLFSVCEEAYNAFENGKRKHHADALTGRCISGCQACAIEKLKQALAQKEAK